MCRLISIAIVAGLMTAGLAGLAQQPTPKIQNVPLTQTSPVNGQQMYANYCAACHGANGMGNGPAASALKTPPVNLTTLSAQNGGMFPAQHVMMVLRMGVDNPAHGSADMPVWGEVMRSLNTNQSETIVNQRIYNLTNYLKTLQK